jgi:membrane fusion protein, multidrug efflux system
MKMPPFRPLPAFALLLPVFWSCSGKPEESQKKSPGPVSVNAEIAREGVLASAALSTAEILPFEHVEILAPVAGTVLSISFEEGQAVREGAQLIQLDDRTWQAELSGVKASLSATQKELNRRITLKESEGASQEEIDRLSADVAQLESRARQLDVQISLAQIRAPFSGVMGLRRFSIGSFMAQGAALTSLAQVDRLKAEFGVPESMSAAIAVGQSISVRANSDTVQARVYAIDPVLDPRTRMRVVKASIPNSSGRIVPGMFAEAVFAVGSGEKRVMVPNECIIPSVEQQSVMVVRGGKAVRQKITPGMRDQTHCEVLAGVQPGDTVITSGILLVSDGSPVVLSKIHDPLAKP